MECLAGVLVECEIFVAVGVSETAVEEDCVVSQGGAERGPALVEEFLRPVPCGFAEVFDAVLRVPARAEDFAGQARVSARAVGGVVLVIWRRRDCSQARPHRARERVVRFPHVLVEEVEEPVHVRGRALGAAVVLGGRRQELQHTFEA